MFNKINYYIFRKFLLAFFITFVILAIILFIGDFVEQLRKSAGKDVPINIILQLAMLNFPNLISYTLPITSFFGSILAFLILIRNSESIIISSAGISGVKTTTPAIILYFFIGIFFITVANPIIAIFDDKYSNLKYEYIDRVDKFASITKNGLWLKQDNIENGFSNVLFAKQIANRGKILFDFMILEYDENGSFNGRIDGKKAELNEGFWEMLNVHITPKYEDAYYLDSLKYKTNIKTKDISDSLSAPSTISIWRLVTFIRFLEDMGYSAIDFKMHLYELVCLPFFISSLVFLAFSLTHGLKQNDKFTNPIIYSLIIIFILYFFSNLLDALGATAQINPVIAELLMPIITISMGAIIHQFNELKRIKII